jgi:autotransporter translocation and assembly factor TamB
VEGLDLARLAPRGTRSLEGTLRAQFLVSGPTSDPDVSVSGGVDAPRIGGVVGDSIRARLEYAPGILTLDSLAWSAGASRASVSGTLRTRRPLETWLREALRGERPWRAETSLALEAEADSFDLSALAPIDSTWHDLAGTVHLRARIGGTMEAPTASLSGRAPRVRVRGLDGSVAGAELEYADRVLRIDRLDVRQGAASTRVTGALPVDLGFFATERWRRDDPIRLSLRMDETDMAVLPELTNLVAASEGKLSGEADVRGTPRRPKVTGSMRLRDGRIRFAGRYEVLEQVAVDGTFDEERLNLTRIEARQGKQGKIAGSGVWRWTGASALPAGSIGPPGEYRLALKATDCVATDREYYLFRFSGTFQIEPGTTPDGVVKPSITGSAVVSRGDLTMNLSAPANEPRAPLPFLYDINAEFPRDLRYRQLDTEVDLAGTLQLRNEGAGDVALGTLTVTGGQFYFLTRKFQDLTGQVNFNSLERLDPDVAIDASTRIRSAGVEHEDRVIYLAITGRASQLQIRPWVEGGGTSPSDLWRELSVGQFTGGADPSAAASDPLTGVKLDYLPIGGYLFRNAERWIAGSGFIDTIDLQTGASSGGATGAKSNLIDLGAVGVGKYVTKDLFLKYSRDFSGENDQRISAEYRVTRHLLLRGTQIQRSPSGNQAEQEYNLDLKIRLEY